MTGGSGLLRVGALVALPVGAVGSVGLMLRAGRTAPPVVMILIALWVFSPFVILALTHVASKRWAVPTRAALYGVMLFIALGSLAIYGSIALQPTRTQTPFFVVVPPASWLLTAIAVAATALISRRRST